MSELLNQLEDAIQKLADAVLYGDNNHELRMECETIGSNLTDVKNELERFA